MLLIDYLHLFITKLVHFTIAIFLRARIVMSRLKLKLLKELQLQLQLHQLIVSEGLSSQGMHSVLYLEGISAPLTAATRDLVLEQFLSDL